MEPLFFRRLIPASYKGTISLFLGGGAHATQLFARNLVYRSPFPEHAQLAHDTDNMQKRLLTHARRQVQDAAVFSDDHYPTFYGGDFSNSPFIWSGGLNFTHSVASGDPFDTSVLLWTRAVPVSPAGSTTLPDQSVPVCISYKITTSSDLSGNAVDSGSAFTSYDVDWTVKSLVGKTRTIPSPDTPARRVNNGKPLSIAVFSCSQFQAGWFNAYGFAAHNATADIFIHLGDYIYESLGNGARIGRQVLGRELATIHDYRQRLNQYQAFTFIFQFERDDHEVADNSWKAGTADSNDTAAGCAFSPSGACFTDRKLAAARAYHEWMPIRQVVPDDKLRTWRNFQIGRLLDLTMLDTRQYDRDLTDVYYNTDPALEFVNSLADFNNRSLMGAAQESWLYGTLSKSKARNAIWRVIGQQIVFTQLNESGTFDVDAWDGYRANRARVLDHLYKNKISNTVILAGDSHANWVSDLAHPNDTSYDPVTGAGAIGVEFAGTAVTSSSSFGSGISPAAADVKSRELVAANRELQWSEGSFRGFFVLSIDSDYLNATYYGMRNISFANLDGFPTAHFVVKNGQNKLSRPVAGGAVQAGVLKSSLGA
ncbi:putative phoD-like phosphatase, N-terminal domain [Lyophyllum shimeji]|uniref:PhoD-like phosphatase, N-terminal domain n=1 Tax=Lyophyllum shimeji TaxID=47721 RepID=A0A9P3UIX3_LYOSH|nr:putative phoD-like phosphatase, N-terminal domain [Lyophyllum shimeji]